MAKQASIELKNITKEYVTHEGRIGDFKESR